MLEKNNCLLEKPELFKTGETLFWEDEYISRMSSEKNIQKIVTLLLFYWKSHYSLALIK